MSKYIELDKALEKAQLACIIALCDENPDDYEDVDFSDEFAVSVNDLCELPPADVVERKRGEWVSVEERLPNIHQRVLVWCESKTIQKHVTTCTFMADYSGKGKGPYFSRHVRNVTHWMPLPEPPKGG